MRRAVVIGVSSYDDDSFSPLAYSTCDAQRMHDLLSNPSYGYFDDVEILLNPKSNEADRKLERVLNDARPGDAVLFYFSGHGKLDKHGSLALALSDTDPKILSSTSLHSDEIKRLFNGCDASQKVIILDCCFSGAISSKRLKSSMTDAVGPIARATGTFVLTASGKFQPAYELPDVEGGALTAVLEQGILSGKAAKPGSAVVTLRELASYAQDEVPRFGQEPQVWDIGGVGDMLISKVRPTFDQAWARRARLYVNGLEAKNVIDEQLHQELIDAIRDKTNPARNDQLSVIDDYLNKRSTFVHFYNRWRSHQQEPPLSPAKPEPDSTDAPTQTAGDEPSMSPPLSDDEAVESDTLVLEESLRFWAEEQGYIGAVAVEGQDLEPAAHPARIDYLREQPTRRQRFRRWFKHDANVVDRTLIVSASVLALALVAILLLWLPSQFDQSSSSDAAEIMNVSDASLNMALNEAGSVNYSNDPQATDALTNANLRDPLRYLSERTGWIALSNGAMFKYDKQVSGTLDPAGSYTLSWVVKNNRTGEELESFCQLVAPRQFPGSGTELADKLAIGDKISVLVPARTGWQGVWDRNVEKIASEESLLVELSVHPPSAGCSSATTEANASM